MTDPRIERYLTERSRQIELPSVGADVIVERARHRQRRRRTGRVAVFGAAVALGGVLVATNGGGERGQEVASLGAAVVDSPLDWSLVTPRASIGWSTSTASAGGAVYNLSTSPGAVEPDSPNQPKHLYRSADGTDWDEVSLPDQLWASALAAEGDTLYAVGTAAAGGSLPSVELASTVDGGGDWSQTRLPVDLDMANAADFPGRLRLGPPAVASVNGTTVVAVTLSGVVDVPGVLASAADSDQDPLGSLSEDPANWYQDQGGLVYARQCEGSTPGGPASTTSTTAVDAVDQGDVEPDGPQVEGGDPAACVGSAGGATGGFRSWAYLGLTPEQAALAEGQLLVFAGPSGGTDGDFVQVAKFDDASLDPSVVTTADGYWLVNFNNDQAVAEVRHSSDGRDWSAQPTALPGWAGPMGVLDGRLGVISNSLSGTRSVELTLISPTGSTSVDISQMLGLDGESEGLGEVAFGPLGMAGIVYGDGGHRLVYTPDGTSFSTVGLPKAAAGTRETVSGLTVTADAVKVRLNSRPASDISGEGPADQRILVGTPRG